METKVILLPELMGEKKQEKKPIEFTHYFDGKGGWKKSINRPSAYEKVVHLGKCGIDGDMFATYLNGDITIKKGHLNDGIV